MLLFWYQFCCVGFTPTLPSNSPIPAGCSTIQLSSYTIYLERASDRSILLFKIILKNCFLLYITCYFCNVIFLWIICVIAQMLSVLLLLLSPGGSRREMNFAKISVYGSSYHSPLLIPSDISFHEELSFMISCADHLLSWAHDMCYNQPEGEQLLCHLNGSDLC